MYEDQIEESTQKASGQDKLVFSDPKTKANSFKLAYGATTS